MAKRKRIKTPAVEMPLSKDEAAEILDKIGELKRQVEYIQTVMNDELALIKQKHEAEAKPVNNELDKLFKRLHLWAEANRETICKKGAKTAKLKSGTISWRKAPASVTIRNQEKVIEILKEQGLNDAIAVKESVDKNYILAHKDDFKDIEGITISNNREKFSAKPFETEVECSKVVTSAKAA